MRFTTPTKTLPTRYTYTGQYSHVSDDATDLGSAGFGLLFYNARWYDPALGRFAQADTIVPGGVQGLDRYAYVNNSPMNFTDPSGHKCVGEKAECEENGNPINGAGGWALPLSTRGQQLTDFADSVGMTPEDVIGIGLGHEMFGWSGEDDRDTHMQAYRNGYLRYVNEHCYGIRSYTCMLNYFAGSYQSVYGQFLTKESGYTKPNLKFWGHRNDYLWAQYKDDEDESNLDETYQKIVESGMDFMGNFMVTISEFSYDGELPLNTGTVNARALNKALGGPPTYELGFLVVQSAICSNGAAAYSLIYNLRGEKKIDAAGLRAC